jgi:hypothetical protein
MFLSSIEVGRLFEHLELLHLTGIEVHFISTFIKLINLIKMPLRRPSARAALLCQLISLTLLVNLGMQHHSGAVIGMGSSWSLTI